MTKPVRLLEGAELPQAERVLLEAGRALPPVPYDVTAGAARLRATLDGLAAGSSGAAATGPLAQAASLAKLALFVIVPTLGALAGYYVWRSSSHTPAPIEAPMPVAEPSVVVAPQPSVRAPEPQPSAAAPAAQPPRAEVAEPVAQAPAAAAARPAPRIAGAGSRRRATVYEGELRTRSQGAAARVAKLDALQEVLQPAQRTQAAQQAQPAPAAKPAQPAAAARVEPTPSPEPAPQVDELQAIARARSLLRNDPEAALALLERIAREHPRGYFVEERLGLTVLALAGAGKDELAEQRGKAFLRAYPSSPYADRVRAVLAR